MTRHLFKIIDSLFRPNYATDKYRIDPISIRKIKKSDVSWRTNKTLLFRAIYTSKQVLTTYLSIKEKLDKSLGVITKYSHCCSKKK